MKHTHGDGVDRPFEAPGEPRERHRGHRHKHRGRHGGKAFGHGELRPLVLATTAERPRHGHEPMRAIEERTGGYSPSPGVIYPMLSWLEDMGHARVETGEGRKRRLITPAGEAFLSANRAAADAPLARAVPAGGRSRHAGVPAPVTRGVEGLKLAPRPRFERGPRDRSATEAIAAAPGAAATAVERG